MTQHMVSFKSVTMNDGNVVDIKYWSDKSSVYLAGFDGADKQVTVVVYSGATEMSDCFNATFQNSLIEVLAEIIENDLLSNPELHYRP